MRTETKTNNRLWQARRRSGLEQKQVARLLGHKNCDQISRYERGARMPGLRIALKLELIYRTPVSYLFPEHYHKLRSEIAAAKSIWSKVLPPGSKGEDAPLPDAHVCTYGNSMAQKKPHGAEIAAAKKHTIHLIQKIAEVIHRRKAAE